MTGMVVLGKLRVFFSVKVPTRKWLRAILMAQKKETSQPCGPPLQLRHTGRWWEYIVTCRSWKRASREGPWAHQQRMLDQGTVGLRPLTRRKRTSRGMLAAFLDNSSRRHVWIPTLRRGDRRLVTNRLSSKQT